MAQVFVTTQMQRQNHRLRMTIPRHSEDSSYTSLLAQGLPFLQGTILTRAKCPRGHNKPLSRPRQCTI